MKEKRMEQHHVKYTRTKWKLQYREKFFGFAQMKVRERSQEE